MKKFKSCIFLILTAFLSVSVFAVNAVPPDKTMFELELIANDAPENGFVNVVEQEPAINSDLIEKTLTAKTLSINQHLVSEFQSFSYRINKVAVVQNQNNDRMYNS